MSESYTTTADSDTDTATDEQNDQSQPPRHVNGTGGDSDLVSLDTGTIQRDENGEIIPRREYVEELDGDAIARPLPGGARERFIEDTLGSGEDITDAMLAEMFTDYLVHPDLTQHPECPDDRVTEEFVSENLTGAQEDAYFFAILLASGDSDLVERLRASRRGQMSEDDIKLLDQLGPERMQELMAEADIGDGDQGN